MTREFYRELRDLLGWEQPMEEVASIALAEGLAREEDEIKECEEILANLDRLASKPR